MAVFISVLLVGCWLVGFTQPAAAYIDPGTGSVIIQGLIGAVAGALVVIRLYWAKISTFLGLSKRAEEPQSKDSDVEA